MASNIVLCSDGTGNSTIKNRGTNVYKLYEAVDIVPSPDKTRQVVFHDDGVGTGSLKFMRAFGGAFAYGFARNLRDLYTNLARIYQPGDAIYLFGFSRGAYLSGDFHPRLAGRLQHAVFPVPAGCPYKSQKPAHPTWTLD